MAKATSTTKTQETANMSDSQLTAEDYANLSPEETQAYLESGSPDGTPEHPDDAAALGANSDFNLNDEYKPTPLAPGGNYKANIVAVAHEASKYALAFKVCFVENDVLMSDGETQLDGTHEYYRCWLPKPGDENEMQANGKVTKRQGKINSMKRMADDLKIDMNTPQSIARAIIEQQWIGIPVIVSVDVEEYQGIIRNRITKIVRDTSRE